jgi:tripartite-type tricarboxylate transporter receptor subunit TctC
MDKGWTFAALGAAMLAAGSMSAPARADAVSDFYQGKRITFLIPNAPGGSYHAYALHLTRYFGKHVPGHPTFVTQNMPGAGGIVAVNYLYGVAPKDGTVIGFTNQTIPLTQLLGREGVKFDVSKMVWIGDVVVSNDVTVAWHETPFKTIQDVMKQEMVVGAEGGLSGSTITPRVMNALVGTRFKIIQGFPGGGPMNLAMERGEIQGRNSVPYAGWKAQKPDWVAQKKLVFLMQAGYERDKDLPDVPLLTELAKTPEDRKILELVSLTPGRAILAPPDIPADRAKALRAAFRAMMEDPEFLTEARKIKMDIAPRFGEDLDRLAANIASTSPEAIAKLKQAIKHGQTYQCAEVLKSKEHCSTK